MSFFADKARQCMKDDRVAMFSDKVRWIDEFLHKNIRELPVDGLLDEVEETYSSYFGKNFDDIKEAIREKNQSVEDVRKLQKEVQKFCDKKGMQN
jgi:hypothetical protein